MGLFGFLFSRKKQKEFFLEWQKAVMPNSPERIVMSYEQLKASTVQQMKDGMRIIKDSFEIVQKTTKPDVFFSRLNLLSEKSNHLASLEQYADFAGIKHGNFSEVQSSVSKSRNDLIKMFLVRYFSETFDKAEAMKTEKGRIGKYQKFYDSLKEYYLYMYSEHIEYIETKYKAYTKH